ncbi:hypothetical protein [Halalkalibacter okhensis]|uniref:hypothetical protein n=1 Tax=Halalkalibacter okhensis TaxID=333138 RepID=UPI00068D11C4|nr:hypothetical protein [Halalkalibacter okhensis]
MDLHGKRPSLTINFSVGFDDYYLVEVDLNIMELTLQPEEVQRVKWATKEEILTIIDQEPYHKSLIE